MDLALGAVNDGVDAPTFIAAYELAAATTNAAPKRLIDKKEKTRERQVLFVGIEGTCKIGGVGCGGRRSAKRQRHVGKRTAASAGGNGDDGSQGLARFVCLGVRGVLEVVRKKDFFGFNYLCGLESDDDEGKNRTSSFELLETSQVFSPSDCTNSKTRSV